MSNIDEKAKNNFTIEIRNGRRLIGKNRVKEILDDDECQGC